MSDTPGGEGWEQGEDGKWYQPGVLSGGGWWRATDGRWYRPESRPVAMSGPGPSKPTVAQRWTSTPTYGKVLAIGGVVLLVLVVIGAALGSPEEDDSPIAAVTTTAKPEPTTTEAAAPTTTTTAAPSTTAAPTTTSPPQDRQLTFEERLDNDDAIGAYDVCKQFVERQLTSPASAEYPDYFEDDGEVVVWQLANGDYRVYSQVDSENGFGASLRSLFECTVDYTGGGNYQLVDLQII